MKTKHPTLAGQQFGRLTALERIGGRSIRYRCACECGKETVAYAHHLRSGHISSCGCWRREYRAKALTTHGMSRTKIYGVWRSMIDRCRNSRHQAFALYGARGIAVCERWLEFANFLSDMGAPSSGLELDRINTNGNYEPGNCRWADRTTQIRNRRNTVRVTHNGVTKTLSEWAQELGVPYHVVQNRHKRLGRVHL